MRQSAVDVVDIVPVRKHNGWGLGKPHSQKLKRRVSNFGSHSDPFRFTPPWGWKRQRYDMSIIGKSVGLGTAFLAGIAIAANAGSLGRADASASATIANPPSSSTPLGSGQPPRRELAALPPAKAAPAPNSVTLSGLIERVPLAVPITPSAMITSLFSAAWWGIAFWLLTRLWKTGDRQVPAHVAWLWGTDGPRWIVVERANGSKPPDRLQPKLSDFVTLQQRCIDIRPLGWRPMADWGESDWELRGHGVC
jgi:hypothetical protein